MSDEQIYFSFLLFAFYFFIPPSFFPGLFRRVLFSFGFWFYFKKLLEKAFFVWWLLPS
jgi:hypothetical protein